MKKKLLAIMVIATMVFSLAACSKNENSSNSQKTNPTKQTSNTTEKDVKEEVPPADIEIPESSPVPETSETSMLDDFTKESIKQFVEPYVNDIYKTSFYTCDILTPTDGSGGIVSIQVESNDFESEDYCKSVIKEMVGNMISSEQYSSINSFEFYMLANSQLKYLIKIDNAQSIGSPDEVETHISLSAF